MDRYLCIHGHFYQPPRENAWLEDVELQDSAYPYHDWNERITAECYAPNTAARILNEKGLIKKILNNYTKISNNFGPTLLDWMEKNEPEVYRAVIEADRISRQKFSGHGSALAQAYNHMIMPLANSRDKYTQVVWGLKDFEKRFGRKPEGMWLPETAVDLESLEIMSEHDIRFTILTQYQARRVRKIGSSEWHEVGPRGIDPSMVYQIKLPKSGRNFCIFFYDGPISQAVAFEHLLSNGERFAHRLMDGFSKTRDWPQLVHIATDGETYGHHHRHGEMALAYAIDHIESQNLARLTNYGEYLEMHPPTHEVEIYENTAWSCAHGVDRWQADCGCHSGMNPDWNQAWRAPLRQALDWLRDNLAPKFEELAGKYLKNPWAARDDYIRVILDRSPENIELFLTDHAVRRLETAEQVTVLKLLEMQRHAMLMYTSCGWFFDDISGIETVQVLQYARRVIQLGEKLFALKLEPNFLDMLVKAKSNVPKYRDGAFIYEKFITSTMVDLPKMGAHYAISSLFNNFRKQTQIFCYNVERLDNQIMLAGEMKMAVGQARIISQITRESAHISYSSVYFGHHNVSGGVRLFSSEESYQEMVQGVTDAFNRADLPDLIRLLDQYFKNGVIYSLKQLFRDQQREILNIILDSTMSQLEADYRKIYEHNASLMRFLRDLGIPMPNGLQCAANIYLNTRLRQSFLDEIVDIDQINVFLKEAKTFKVDLNEAMLKYVMAKTLERAALQFYAHPTDLSLLEKLDMVTGLTCSLPFKVDLWKAQNIYYKLLQTVYNELQKKAAQGDEGTRVWIKRFASLGDKLRIQRRV